jgi:hypothetical protein
MKVVSRIYSNQKLAIFGEVIEFKNGIAEISNDLFKKIVESKFPNIFKEGEAPQQKNADQIDTDKTIEVLKEEYNSEIDRLKNIITTKDKQIKDLKDEVKTWKKAVENLKKQIPAVVKEVPSNEKKLEENVDEKVETDDIRTTLEKMPFEELKKLAIEEGLPEKDIEKTKDAESVISMLMVYYESTEE